MNSSEPKSPASLNETIDSIRLAVEELHFVASVIRKSSVRSQNYNLSSGFEREDEPYFENYVSLIIRHTFPHARRSLCKQLAESVALRRKRMFHKIWHNDKLKTRWMPSRINTNLARASRVIQSRPPLAQSRPSPAPACSPHEVRDRVIPTESVDTMSRLDAGMARRGLRAGLALSTLSMGSSVRLTTREYPPKPHIPPGATDCACPYCAQRLPTAKLSNIPTFWE